MRGRPTRWSQSLSLVAQGYGHPFHREGEWRRIRWSRAPLCELDEGCGIRSTAHDDHGLQKWNAWRKASLYEVGSAGALQGRPTIIERTGL